MPKYPDSGYANTKMVRSSSQAQLANKETYYETVTRNVRWIAIAIVILTFPPSQPQYKYLLAATMAAVVFNSLRYSRLMRSKLFASRITTLVLDNLLIAVLLYLSGGIHSPYVLFLVFTIISSAYWYGGRGIALVLGWQIMALTFMAIWQPKVLSLNLATNLAIMIFALVALAVLAERLTRVDRNERSLLARANHEIEAERERMVTLINSLADPVLAIDNVGQITVYNGAALDLLNTNQQLSGAKIAQLVQLEDDKGQTVPFESIMGHPSVLKRTDLILRLADGSSVNLDLSVAPIRGTNTGDLGYILLLRDITKQKSLDQERDEFISVTSHELRTPVAIAEANLSTALLPNFAHIDAKALTLLDQAHQNIIFLGQLIKDLSTLSKAEQGRLKIEIESIEPDQLIEQLVNDYQAEAHTKGLVIKSHIKSKLKPILSSPNLVHEILQNLITNALKYTEKGTITLSAEPGEDASGVVFSVADTGIGISVTDRKKLFTKFYRSEDYRTRKTNGTGLGLYITKKLAERLGAKLSFTSQLNRGSVFSLWVPAIKDASEDHRSVVKATTSKFFD
ncbi:MAG TPA: ATP-binding protein [Candidatus Saccharimonadales bacterium]|nr:ATP-binding protein [Candidatus Saccharimonadales bacterium]